jgi:EAL domain-containing protein (putative c-di-GMP-specific phosphodiesterase class I)
MMKKYKVSPDKINIEITESYDSLNEEIAEQNIRKLKEYGINFSLDDYGTGYSNIERFSILPISLVKIDKSLVDSSDNIQMQAVLKNTFGLIKSLSRKTIIEGVETEEQANRFIGFDCDNIQGYYYSKPLSYDEFIKFVKEKNK